MPKKPSDDSEMLAFLKSKTADHIADYSNRGRPYRTLSEEDLIESWESAWNDLESEPLSEKKRDIQADLAAEFALRKLEVPWVRVRTQIDVFLAASGRAHKKWSEKNPEAAKQAEATFEIDLQEFRDARKKSN